MCAGLPRSDRHFVARYKKPGERAIIEPTEVPGGHEEIPAGRVGGHDSVRRAGKQPGGPGSTMNLVDDQYPAQARAYPGGSAG
jgi:hypothetical protein